MKCDPMNLQKTKPHQIQENESDLVNQDDTDCNDILTEEKHSEKKRNSLSAECFLD